jgi:hypothetical protein
MSRTSTWRRRVLVGAAGVLATLALAACGSNGGNPNATTTTPSGDTYFGGAPSGSPTPTGGATSPSGGGSGGGGGTNTPSYPTDAKGYSVAFLAAWANLDYNRMSDLGVQGAVQQVKDSVNLGGGNVNSNWSYRSCNPDQDNPTNQTDCIFDNAHGDETKIVLNNSQIGHPTAVLQAQLERTTYPGDPGSYVSEFFSAYQNGNVNRVVRLSNTTVKGALDCKLLDGTQQLPPTPLTSDTVSVTLTGGNAGGSYTFEVLASPGGKAGAVKRVITKSCV